MAPHPSIRSFVSYFNVKQAFPYFHCLETDRYVDIDVRAAKQFLPAHESSREEKSNDELQARMCDLSLV